ncbi:MAG TPA: hypothetical protein VFO78_10945 [Candidatus Limnocylindrales bacterium]|nr:hypothetical protein [Candidatus Limnocylindrales bacterium]
MFSTRESGNGIAGGAASSLGPHRDELVAEWFVDRLGGRPMDDRLRYVTTTGTVFGEEIDFSRLVAATVAGRGPR